MKHIIFYLFFLPIAAVAQTDTTAAFILSQGEYEWSAVFRDGGTLGNETLILSEKDITVQIEKTRGCNFSGSYDSVGRKAFYVLGDTCLNYYRFRETYESDRFSFIFSDKFPTTTCAYCFCFSAEGHTLVAKPNGSFEFDGRRIFKSFTSYLELYVFLTR